MWTQDNENSPYGEYTCQISYSADMGELQIPVCGPDGSESEIVSVAAPAGMKIVTWAAVRDNAYPKIPSPKPANSNERLLTMCVSPYTFIMTANGVKVWRVEGVYTYACRLPHNETTDMPMGRPPFSDESANQAVKPNDYFELLPQSPKPTPTFLP